MKRKKPSYLILILLALIFVSPGIAAYYVFKHPWLLTAEATNKGELLKPPILLSDVQTHAKWQLILWEPNACDDTCLQQVDRLARIRLALGRHLYQIDALLLLGPQTHLSAQVLKRFADQDIHVKMRPTDSLPENTTIYIGNPDSYLVLAYAVNAQSQDIYHDLKYLLNAAEKN